MLEKRSSLRLRVLFKRAFIVSTTCEYHFLEGRSGDISFLGSALDGSSGLNRVFTVMALIDYVLLYTEHLMYG